MNTTMKSLSPIMRTVLLAWLALALPVIAHAADPETAETSGRAVAAELDAEVVAIDLTTREVTLRVSNGFEITLVAPEKVIKLEDVKVGDHVVGTFFAALEGEVRVPTAEELAEPWVELQSKSVSSDPAHPGVDTARVIRAVVTIKALSPEQRVVLVQDSRGRDHFIGDVEPAKMAGVTVGQKAVIVFTEAMAVTLEKQPATAK